MTNCLNRKSIMRYRLQHLAAGVVTAVLSTAACAHVSFGVYLGGPAVTYGPPPPVVDEPPPPPVVYGSPPVVYAPVPPPVIYESAPVIYAPDPGYHYGWRHHDDDDDD